MAAIFLGQLEAAAPNEPACLYRHRGRCALGARIATRKGRLSEGRPPREKARAIPLARFVIVIEFVEIADCEANN